MKSKWNKIGRIIDPKTTSISWIGSHCGAAFALSTDDLDVYDIYLTGRDRQGRSQIGKFTLRIEENKASVIGADEKPCFVSGEVGTFDQDGVSYPWIVRRPDDQTYMYYVGWVKGVNPPFQNNIGLAALDEKSGNFVRISRAPIIERSDFEPFGTGSCSVYKVHSEWRMWYTSFQGWKFSDGRLQPIYTIKSARSFDGKIWDRIQFAELRRFNNDNYCQARPNIIELGGTQKMWFCSRGVDYRIHAASSDDLVSWQDEGPDIELSPFGWDGSGMAYPHLFRHRDRLCMIYSGNEYGRAGLGLAIRLDL